MRKYIEGKKIKDILRESKEIYNNRWNDDFGGGVVRFYRLFSDEFYAQYVIKYEFSDGIVSYEHYEDFIEMEKVNVDTPWLLTMIDIVKKKRATNFKE